MVHSAHKGRNHCLPIRSNRVGSRLKGSQSLLYPFVVRSDDRRLHLVYTDAVKLKLDLHEIYNRGDDIDRALRAIIVEAVEKKARLVEIIPGKGSGQLKKRVLRFLDQDDIKAMYDRVEKDSHNFGRVFVHFKKR